MDKDLEIINARIKKTCTSIPVLDIPVSGPKLFFPGPKFVSMHWRSATSIAIQPHSTKDLKVCCDDLCVTIESLLSEYTSTEEQGRIVSLQRIVQRCMDFKQHLERQEDRYVFLRTSPGERYIGDRMRSITNSRGTEKCVQLSLWPGLVKCVPDAKLLVVPEVVMTSDVKNEHQADENQTNDNHIYENAIDEDQAYMNQIDENQVDEDRVNETQAFTPSGVADQQGLISHGLDSDSTSLCSEAGSDSLSVIPSNNQSDEYLIDHVPWWL
ncbi:hypothetical protein BDV29DRAFT_179885 [Aspergillus leporis]|uniref:Uncharacterized protein n=1 Tax=Aspergillus leporis TaxID=41062 RepID=A0A5N5WR53_9EURO|nr:hypothetical protein BDV29DRAFT_179885 [Aspergillus leporis]